MEDCKIGRLQHWKIATLEDWKVATLENCKIVNIGKWGALENGEVWKIATLEDWKVVRSLRFFRMGCSGGGGAFDFSFGESNASAHR